MHKLSEVPGFLSEDENTDENEDDNEDEDEEEQPLDEQTHHNSGTAHGINVRTPATGGSRANKRGTAHVTNVRTPATGGARVNNKELKIVTLFQRGVLRVGDLWKFSFVFETTNGECLVQKVGTVSHVIVILHGLHR